MDYKLKYEELNSEFKAQQRQLDLIQSAIVSKSYNLGQKHFETIVKHLNEALKADYTLIGRLQNQSIETISFYGSGKFLTNFEYNLAYTPCEKVIRSAICLYTDNVTSQYPKDKLLVEMGIEGYVGVPLFDSEMNPIGIIASLYKKTVYNPEATKSILQIFTYQAGAELEHQSTYKKLEEAKNKLKEQNIKYQVLNQKLHKNVHEAQIAKEELSFANEQLHAVIDLLEKNETKLIEAQRVAKLGYYNFDIITGLWTNSAELDNIFGINLNYKKDVEGWLQIVHPEHREMISEYLFETVIGKQQKFNKEYKIICIRTGQTKWVHGLGNLILNDKGEPVIMFGTIQDITQRKLAENALRSSERKLQSIFRVAPTGIGMVKNQILVEVNPQICKITGYSKNELIGQSALMLYPSKKEFDIVNKIRNKQIEERGTSVVETQWKRKDGSNIDIIMSSTPVNHKDLSQEVTFTALDISNRKNLENELKKSQERFKLAMRATNDGIFDWNLITNEIYFSPGWKRMLGYKDNELKNDFTFWEQLTDTQDLVRISESFIEHLTGKQNRLELDFKMKHKNGEWVDILLRANALFNSEGKAVRIVGTHFDITERKRKENIKAAHLRLVEFSANHTVKEVLQKFLDEAEILTNSKVGFFHFLEEDRETIALQAWSTNTIENMCSAESEGLHYPITEAGVWVECIYKRKPVIHNDYENLKHKKGLPDGHAKIIRELTLPVIREDKIVAVLGVGNKETDYRDWDVKTLQELADLVWEIVIKKQTEENLIKERNRAQDILEGTNAGTWDWNIQTGEVIFNERWTKMLGYDYKELELNNYEALIKYVHPDDLKPILDLINKHFKKEVDYFDIEGRAKHKNGDWKWVNARGKVVEWSEVGAPLRMSGTAIDISERKRIESELHTTQMHYTDFINNSSDAVSYWKAPEDLKIDLPIEKQVSLFLNSVCLDANKASWQSVGFKSREEQIGEKYSDLLKERITGEYIRDFIENGYIINNYLVHEKLISDKDWYGLINMYGVVEEDVLKYIWISSKDITKEKIAENQLRESEKRYKTLADFTYDWEYWRGPDDNYIYVSPACSRISGYSVDEFMNNPELFKSIIYEEDLPLWEAHKKDESKRIEYKNPKEFRIKTRNGKIKWINHVCRPVYDDKGVFLGNRGTNRDITVQKLSQIALTQSEMRFKQLADFTFEAILIHKNGIVQNANAAFIKLTGYKEEELIGKSILDIVIPNKYKQEVISKMQIEYSRPFEIEIIRKDNERIPVEVMERWILSEKDKLRVVAIRDITEQKQMQQKILNTIILTEEQERKRVAQELHDGLGPVLSTIKLYTETYIKSDKEEFKEKIKKQLLAGIDDALNQVSSISNNLSPHVLSDFGLKVAISKFIEKVQKVSDVSFYYNFSIDVPLNQDVEITLYRIAIELINNSLKHAKANNISVTFFKIEKDIRLTYKDDGIGFDFNKVKQAKTGMGLFNISNRIKSFNGTVNFIKLKNKGIRYDITIPCS